MTFPLFPNRGTTAILMAVLALWSFGCKPTDPPSGTAGTLTGGNTGAATIKVGEYASLTGSEAAFGQSSHKGTMLAFEELNAAGGVLGKKFEHLVQDTLSKAGESATIAKKFISQDKVVCLLGEVASGRSLEAAPICQQSGIPMISPSSTNPKVTEAGDCIFRICFTDPFQGRLLADFARRTLKAKRVAILSDVSSAYSVGLANFFSQPFKEAGGQIISEQKFQGQDKDFKAQLTQIKAANPDAICVPAYYTQVGLIVKQARDLGITVAIFGGDGWEAPELITIAGGAALKNTYFSTHFSSVKQSPEVQKFVSAYKAHYNGETPDAMAALGYDSAMVLADAIRRAGSTDGAALKKALATTDYAGVTGRTRIDAKRDAPKAAVVITVENNQFKFVEAIEP